jgi:excisionase family DNA binding protein
MSDYIQLLKITEVCARLSIGRSQVYRLVQQKVLPPPIHIGKRSARWVESELNNYLRIKTRKQG